MQLLLDTHALLWWLSDDPRLGLEARVRIGAAGTAVFVSAATAWEIAIKRAAGKIEAAWDIRAEVEAEGFLELSIDLEHAVAAAELPKHHGDPFDRMLVAQARSEGMWLVTCNDAIRRYDVPWIDAGV